MITIKDLEFAYKQKQVFSNIELEFLPGNIYGLLGENGVGKTTLLKLICGLQEPKCGTCKVDNMTSFDRQPSMLSDLFFLPDTVVLPDSTTPQCYADELAPFYPKFSQENLLRMLQELEVDGSWKFAQMSYGQQKKALIAVALSMGTKYILLDEPTNGLDIPSKSQFRKIISQRIDEDTTIIISTHQVKDVENLIDPIVILTQNNVLLNATMEQIAQKLYFEYGTESNPSALFSEMQPGGWLNVVVNTTGEESQINIEALFNAAHLNPAIFKELFK